MGISLQIIYSIAFCFLACRVLDFIKDDNLMLIEDTYTFFNGNDKKGLICLKSYQNNRHTVGLLVTLKFISFSISILVNTINSAAI